MAKPCSATHVSHPGRGIQGFFVMHAWLARTCAEMENRKFVVKFDGCGEVMCCNDFGSIRQPLRPALIEIALIYFACTLPALQIKRTDKKTTLEAVGNTFHVLHDAGRAPELEPMGPSGTTSTVYKHGACHKHPLSYT